MKICFVDHVLHHKTRSSAFMVKILRELGEVTELSADPDDKIGTADDHIVRHYATTRYDLWVFWQTDYVAARLVPLGLRNAVIVPMYDASWDRTDAFFRQFVNSRFISFSWAMHERLQRLKLRSAMFQYWPEPVSSPPERSFARADWSAFFWERRPLESPNARGVMRQCQRLGIGRLHVHLAADFAEDSVPDAAVPRPRANLCMTTSRWFERPEDYRAVSRAAQFMFAPRLTEGIGMAILEAMAAGQIVIAPNRPTANQTLGHLASGILYDPKRPLDLPAIDEKAAAALSKAALSRVAFGHEDWLRDRPRLVSILNDDGRRWSSGDPSAGFHNALRTAARERLIRDA